MKFTKLFFALLLSLSTFQVSASHLMGGNITYGCLGNNTYAFTAELYRDCAGITLGNSITLDLTSASCGQNMTITLELVPSGAEIVTPICSTEPDLCNGGSGVYGVHKYVYTHVPASQGQGVASPPVVLSSCSDWVISYNSCCRNVAISTLANAGSFHISTMLNTTNNICNNSPTFGFDPILYTCIGDTVSYSHGVYDTDNDSLVFSLIPCQESATASVNYNAAYSGTNPLTTSYSSFDPTTGTLTFVPNTAQVGVICMLAEEYRNGVKVGDVMRDIQIWAIACSNQSPILSGINGTATSNGATGSNTISTCAGQNVCFTIDAYDGNTAQTIGLEYTNSLPGATYSVNTTGNTAQVTICWTPSLTDLGTNHFGLSISDDNCPSIGQNNYSYSVVVTGVAGGATFGQTSIYQGTSSQFQVNLLDTNCTVTWTADPTLSCTNCLNPVATPQTTTTYYYQINCPSGACGSISDSIVVTVLIPKTLTGVVSQSDGSPLANSLIYARDLQGMVLDSTTSDAMGNYTLLTTNSTIFVSATPNAMAFDQAETYYNQSLDFMNATVYTFPNGTSTGTLNFATIELDKTVSGTVTRSTGLSLALSKVYLLDNSFNLLDSVLTNLSGQYSFTTLENEVHLLAVPSITYTDQIPTFYDGSSDMATATLITFASLQTTINFSTLIAPPSIVGTVSRSDGMPLSNSWVHLIDSSMTNIDSIQTSAQGYYAFVVPDVTIDYFVKATPGSSHGDQVITYYNGSETIQAANPIGITTIFNVADFMTIDTFSLTGGKGIGGTVNLGTDFTATPLADVRLILKDANGNFLNDAITNDDGKFNFYGLTDGSYTIFVDKVGLDNELAPIVTLTANEPSPDSLSFLLHSYYLEMLNPNTTTEIFNAQNIAIYPNPIQTTFTVEYDLTTAAEVSIDILDVTGRVVSAVLNEKQVAGEHLLKVNETASLSDGVYFVRISIDGLSTIQKVIKQ